MSARGYVLLQVLVFALFVSSVSATIVALTMSRRTLAERHDASLQARSAVETAHARAASCLSALGPACEVPASGCEAACGVPCAQAFGKYALSLGDRGFTVDVRVEGTEAACRIEVECLKCSGPAHEP
jgi:hypothetical protein